jgi:predicted RND superfamily exporter protein
MLARNAYLVQERIYPLVQLAVGIVFTFGCIGLLGYGMLALVGY